MAAQNPVQSHDSLTFTVTPHFQDFRIDVYLTQMIPWRSRQQIHKGIEQGTIRLNEKKTKAAKKIKSEDIVWVGIPSSEMMDSVSGEDKCPALEIIFEDEFFLAVNKPGNIAVHPNKRYLHHNVMSLLARERRKKGDDSSKTLEMRLLHRLDLETSGVLLLSKNKIAHLPVAQQFEERKIKKTYLAIVTGSVLNRQGKISGDVVKDKKSQVALKKTVDSCNESEVHTDYQVIQKKPQFTLLEVSPKGGKQHQIRVHLASLGHPIVGDKLYGPSEEYFLSHIDAQLPYIPSDLVLPRQALHAWKLSFEHPFLNENLVLCAPLPKDFVQALSLLGLDFSSES